MANKAGSLIRIVPESASFDARTLESMERKGKVPKRFTAPSGEPNPAAEARGKAHVPMKRTRSRR